MTPAGVARQAAGTLRKSTVLAAADAVTAHVLVPGARRRSSATGRRDDPVEVEGLRVEGLRVEARPRRGERGMTASLSALRAVRPPGRLALSVAAD